MQLIALVVLFWQRRRVVPLLRRGWTWMKDGWAGVPSTGRRGRAVGLAREAAARGWRAVDTEANAGRLARFVSWMRAMTSSGTVATTASAPKSAV